MSNDQLNIPQLLAERQAAVHKALRQGAFDPDLAYALRHSVRVLGSSPVLLALGSDHGPDRVVVDEKKMSVTLPISTARTDRMGDVVMPKGCLPHIENYTRNPRVFFSHKSTDHPVGSARNPDDGSLALQVTDDGIVSTCYFHGETSESEVVFRLVKRKELQAASIGFLPVKASLIKTKSGDDEDDDGEKVNGERVVSFKGWMPLRFLEWDLTEWSIVPVPANPDACEALTLHLEKGHVEGEAIPASVRKALEPYKLKARVWSPGFNPETTKFSGVLALGDRELEYDGGLLKRIDDHEFKQQQEDDSIAQVVADVQQQLTPVDLSVETAKQEEKAALVITEDALSALVEKAVNDAVAKLSAYDDTAGGTLTGDKPKKGEGDVTESEGHVREEMALLKEIKACLDEVCKANDKAHNDILQALSRLEKKQVDEQSQKDQDTAQQIRSIINSFNKSQSDMDRRLERLTGSRR